MGSEGEGSAGQAPEDVVAGVGDGGVEAAHQVAEEDAGGGGGYYAGSNVVADGNDLPSSTAPGVGEFGHALLDLGEPVGLGPHRVLVHHPGEPQGDRKSTRLNSSH